MSRAVTRNSELPVGFWVPSSATAQDNEAPLLKRKNGRHYFAGGGGLSPVVLIVFSTDVLVEPPGVVVFVSCFTVAVSLQPGSPTKAIATINKAALKRFIFKLLQNRIPSKQFVNDDAEYTQRQIIR